MKYSALITLLAVVMVTSAKAGTPISPVELPPPVAAALNDYFPNSQILSAERDRDDGEVEYEVLIRYKAIRLEVELRADGRITDVEMDD